MKRRYIFGGIILVSLVGFFYLLATFDLGKVYSLLTEANLVYLGAFLAFSVAMLFGFALIWQTFLQPLGITIPLGTLFQFRMAGFAVSYVTPGPRVGGEVVRANLATDYGDFSDLVVASIMGVIAIFLASVLLVVASLLLAPFIFSAVSWSVFAGTASVLLLVFSLLWWYYHTQASFWTDLLAILDDLGVIPEKYEQDIDNFFAKIRLFFTQKRHVLFRGTAVAVVCKMLLATQMFFLMKMLGLPTTVLQALLLASAIEVAYAIPGFMGIGFLEAGQAGILALVGLPAGIGVLTALLVRGRDLLVSAYGFGTLSFYSGRDGL